MLHKNKKIIGIGLITLGIIGIYALKKYLNRSTIYFYEYQLQDKNLQFYWKKENGERIKNIGELKHYLHSKNKKLLFAINGGMFTKEHAPLGLYIENGVEITPLDTIKNAYGNFYMQPNGVFYLSKENKAYVVTTDNFKNNQILYATQSGPMLVVGGKINPNFNENSTHKTLRSGVGILPNGNPIFAYSEEPITFYEFALFFKEKDCENALFLDGHICRMYLPEENLYDELGDLGVLIGQSEYVF